MLCAVRTMKPAGPYLLSGSRRRYWQKKGLLPDPDDTSLIGIRRRRFFERCLQMGFRPARLMKLKQAADSIKKELHQLSFYSVNSDPLSQDLVIRSEDCLEEPGTGQLLFAFSEPVKTQITSLKELRDSLNEILCGDETQLENRLQDYIARHPDSLEAWMELGNLLFGKSQYVEAEACYERAFAIDSSCAEAMYNIAGCYLKRGKYAAAIRAYKQSIQIRPLPEALYSLGLLYLSLNYRDRAIQALQAVMQFSSGEWAESARQLIEDMEQLFFYGDTE